jgi:hypothetical protein
MKQKEHTVIRLPKFNRKIVETEVQLIHPNHDHISAGMVYAFQ